jgi:hypothetical protein
MSHAKCALLECGETRSRRSNFCKQHKRESRKRGREEMRVRHAETFRSR